MTHVVVVGAGPAGAALSYLLASRGLEVTLLERQTDSAREFRGEVLMPSGVEVIDQLGLSGPLAEVPQCIQTSISMYLNQQHVFTQELSGGLFETHPARAISQPALLEMLIDHAAAHPTFRIERGVSVIQLIKNNGRVAGVRTRSRENEREWSADLVIGADGRGSMIRKRGEFERRRTSVPLDILWFKFPLLEGWSGPRAYMGRGHFFLAYQNSEGLLQAAWIIRKGSYGQLKSRTVKEWVMKMAEHVSPDLSELLLDHADSVEKPILLSAEADHVKNWSIPGALLLGDAAHSMSPVGGQGVNIALRDTVVAANHLIPALHSKAPEALEKALKAIEKERRKEVRTIQRLQALPPLLGFSHAWWSEPLRSVASTFLAHPQFRMLIGPRMRAVPFGVTKVKLTV